MDYGINQRKLDTLQGRLTYLFEHVRPYGRKPYSLREVAEGILDRQKNEHEKLCEQARERGASEPPFEPVNVTASYLHYLRNGERDNPGILQIAEIAKFFGVPASFLLGETDVVTRVADELSELSTAVAVNEAGQSTQVAGLAVKARGLSPELLAFLSSVLEQARTLEDPEQGQENRK